MHNNLYVVGDEDQSIYRWRGADYRNLERFRRDFKGANVILLEQTTVQPRSFLDCAMAVINQTRTARAKSSLLKPGLANKLRLIVAEDDREEAQLVVTDIRDGIRMGRNPSEFCHHVSHQRAIAHSGRGFPPRGHQLSAGGRAALLRAQGSA